MRNFLKKKRVNGEGHRWRKRYWRVIHDGQSVATPNDGGYQRVKSQRKTEKKDSLIFDEVLPHLFIGKIRENASTSCRIVILTQPRKHERDTFRIPRLRVTIESINRSNPMYSAAFTFRWVLWMARINLLTFTCPLHKI